MKVNQIVPMPASCSYFKEINKEKNIQVKNVANSHKSGFYLFIFFNFIRCNARMYHNKAANNEVLNESSRKNITHNISKKCTIKRQS